MNCELTRKMTNEAHMAAAESDVKTRLCEGFAQALHAMAQPLTVLLGTLGALKMRGASGPDAGRYLEMSHTQVERLCGLMTGVQCLLDQVQCDPVCIPVNLCQVIASILEDEDSNLWRSGLRMSVAKLDGDVQVLADQGRTKHAVQAILRAISGISSKGDEIYFKVDPHDGFADLMVHVINADGKRLSSIERLHLSLAETSIRSQQGHFEFWPEPLRITLKLPLHHQVQQRAESSDHFALMEYAH